MCSWLTLVLSVSRSQAQYKRIRSQPDRNFVEKKLVLMLHFYPVRISLIVTKSFLFNFLVRKCQSKVLHKTRAFEVDKT